MNTLLSAEAARCVAPSSIIRLVGAVLAEQHDEWAEGRRYPGLEVLAKSQQVDTIEEATNELTTIAAITA